MSSMDVGGAANIIVAVYGLQVVKWSVRSLVDAARGN